MTAPRDIEAERRANWHGVLQRFREHYGIERPQGPCPACGGDEGRFAANHVWLRCATCNGVGTALEAWYRNDRENLLAARRTTTQPIPPEIKDRLSQLIGGIGKEIA